MTHRVVLAALGLLLTTSAHAQRPAWAAPVAGDESSPTGIREVTASPREVILLSTRLRYTTLILLPPGDEVMDVLVGDKDNFVISTTANMVHVKPAKAGVDTNLNIVTASNAVYTFLLRESSKTPTDLKVSVVLDPSSEPVKRKWVPVADLEAAQAEVVAIRATLGVEHDRAEEQIAEAKRRAPTAFHFAYGTVPDVKPFHVKAIMHDGRFTYIRSEAKEKPALYELKDGAASILEYQLQGDVYVVPKVLDRAYLALGKERLEFALKDESGN